MEKENGIKTKKIQCEGQDYLQEYQESSTTNTSKCSTDVRWKDRKE